MNRLFIELYIDEDVDVLVAKLLPLSDFMDTSTHLYILCGLPFAGKSTLGKRMSELLGCSLVQLDAINDELGVGLAGAPILPREWEATYNEFHARTSRWLHKGETVICDAASFTRAQRDVLRGIAAQAGASASVIYVRVSPDVAAARWRQNRIQPSRGDVSDENFAYVLDNFESPASDEVVLLYDGSRRVDEWVRDELMYE